MPSRFARALQFTFLLAFPLASACSSEETPIDPAMQLVSRDAAPAETGKAAALTAIQTAALAGDLHAFLQGSLSLSSGGLLFSAPAGCTHRGSFGTGGVMLDHDCTMPSGRRTAGSLSIRLGSSCSRFGIAVEYHLLVESSPGAGDQLQLDGSTNLAIDDGRIHLATTLESHVAAGGHAIDHSIAGCFILDHRALTMAMNGHVISAVDGVSRSVAIRDLQMSFCEGIPYTGVVEVDADGHHVEVKFDRTTPETAIVDVEVDGNTAHVELGLLEPQRECAIRTSGGAPMMIDYASCGGCGQPPPPKAPPSYQDGEGPGL